MKKAVGLFFLLNLMLPAYAFAQENASFDIPSDYKATKILDNLNGSNFFTFDFEGNYIINENKGNVSQIVEISPTGERTVLLDHLTQPIIGLSFHNGQAYVVSRGRISIIKKGKLSDIVSGLPASGDYSNGPIVFQDGKMYFSVGTATNSGIVGPDNTWLFSQPSVHDLACEPLMVNQIGAASDNVLTKKKNDKASTGPFQPFNTPPNADTVSASEKCNGSILRANPDGSGLEIVAYGLHNPKGISFDVKGNLYTIDQAMEDRGSRPVKGGLDSLFKVKPNIWYGWPDYNAGNQVENPLIKLTPNVVPKPEATFDPNHLSQFTINQFTNNSGFAVNDGKLSEINLSSSKINDVITPKDGKKVTQIKFGPDKYLYALVTDNKTSELWKIESVKHGALSLGTSSSRLVLPMVWSISLTITLIGMFAAYLVYHNQQKKFRL